jgi:hypothetical protein
MSHYTLTFSHRNDLVDGNIGDFVDLAAGPGDDKRVDLGVLAKPKVNARIARRHVTGSPFCLFDANQVLRGELEFGTNAIAVRFDADQLDLEPVIAVV